MNLLKSKIASEIPEETTTIFIYFEATILYSFDIVSLHLKVYYIIHKLKEYHLIENSHKYLTFNNKEFYERNHEAMFLLNNVDLYDLPLSSFNHR